MPVSAQTYDFSSIISLYFVLYIYHSSIHTQPKNHHKHNEHPCYLLYQSVRGRDWGWGIFCPAGRARGYEAMPRRTGQQGTEKGAPSARMLSMRAGNVRILANQPLYIRKGVWACAEKRPFYIREHAPLARWRRPSWSKKGIFSTSVITFWFHVGYKCNQKTHYTHI